MKKLCGLLIASSMFISIGAGIASSINNYTPAFAWGGEGTSENPYQISTVDDFVKFRNIVNGTGGETKNASACAILKADIDLGNTSSDKTVQLGTEASPYNGTFDGDGHTISNLYIDTGTQDTVGGLFTFTGTSAIIKNFTINGTVNSKKPSGVVGVNRGTITNVTNRVNISVNNCGGSYTDYRAGGIAAENRGGTITYCTNYGDIYSYNYGGGIVGRGMASDSSQNGHIEHCVNYGLVSMTPEGYTWSAYYLGGIIGRSGGNYIVECIHAGRVYGQLYIAGIIGEIADNGSEPHIIDKCLSVGTVECSSSSYNDGIGAIVGNVDRGNIINANEPDSTKMIYYNYYLQGTVSKYPGTTISNCGFGETNSTNVGTGHKDVNGQAQVLSAANIKNKSNFKNWTFGNFYEMGKDYPVPSEVAIEQDIELIDSIGTVEYTDACKAKLDDASRVYNGLTETHKAAVTNYDVLVADLEEYAELKADHDAANAVTTLINAIGTVEYTETSKAKIDAARAGYDALTDTQKGLVSEETYNILLNAEATYAQLKADHDAADAVKSLINAIGTVEYTNECKAKIDAARTGYEALTEAQKALISEEEYKVLTDAEASYAELKADHDAADTVTSLINAIGTVEYTNECKAKIDAARAGYDALTDAQKTLISEEEYKLLTDAEASYVSLENQAKADAVKELIDEIGDVQYNEATKERIEEAREAYDALTPAQKELVKNYKILEDAEVKYEELVNAPKFPGWAVALIAVGGLLVICCIFLLVLFIFFPRYIVDYSAKKVIRVIYVKKHYDMVLMLDTHLRKVRRNEVDVYKTRSEAEEALKK